MLHVCLAGILGLVVGPPAGEPVAHSLSAKAATIEAKVVALSQQNEAMQAGKVAAQGMRAAEMSPGDRYYLGSLAFDAYIVAHINAPSATALCEARRVAQAMTKAAPSAKEKAAARGLVGQANGELAKLQPPGQCGPRAARVAKPVPELMGSERAGAAAEEADGAGTRAEAGPAVGSSGAMPERGAGSTASSGASGGAVPERGAEGASGGAVRGARSTASSGASSGAVPGRGPAEPSGGALAGDRVGQNEGSSPPGSGRFVVPVGSAPRPGDPGRRWTPRAWAGLGTVVLGVGLVAGTGGSLRGRRLANEAIEGVDRAAEAANRELTMEEALRVQDANGRWHRLTTVAIVTGTVGAAALLTGAVLIATGVRRRVDVSPWGDRTSAGLSIAGRF